MNASPRAVLLLSGGLDSATCLAIARAEGFEVHALTVDYGQRHARELEHAAAVARALGAASQRVVRVDLRAIGGSSLTSELAVEKGRVLDSDTSIPDTYVPARNTLLLSLALGLAEVVGARTLFLGITAVDGSNYPDCRPAFVAAFEGLAQVATRVGATGGRFEVRAPLLSMSKAEIIRRGTALGVDYGLTHSCYAPDSEGRACGGCDSCRLRRRGFEEAGVPDPTRYAE